MANIHVLEQSNGLYRIAFHVATPAGTNSPLLAWSAALTMSGLGGTTVLRDGAGTGTDGGISTAEKATIVAGTIYEVVQSLAAPPGMTLAQLGTWLDAHYAALVTEVQAQLQTQLQQFGRTR